MQSFLLKELCLPVCCEHAQNQAGLYSLTCPRWCLFLLSMPQSLHPHKACLISHHQPTLITLFSTFKDISEQTERGRVRAVPSIAITVVSSRVQCVSQCSRERTKNRKPTSQALCFPRQGLRSAAQPHWDRCHLPEHHHPRDLLSSPRATGSVPGIQMLCLSPGWYWWSSNKSEKQRQGSFSSLSTYRREIWQPVQPCSGLSVHRVLVISQSLTSTAQTFQQLQAKLPEVHNNDICCYFSPCPQRMDQFWPFPLPTPSDQNCLQVFLLMGRLPWKLKLFRRTTQLSILDTMNNVVVPLLGQHSQILSALGPSLR